MSKVGALIIMACGAAMAANAYAAHLPRATQEIRAAQTSTVSSASTSTSAGSSGSGTTGSMSAPEIDPGSAFSALMLLGASVAVLRGRRQK